MQESFAGPCFGPSELAVGVSVFLYLVIHSLSQLHTHADVFSPVQFSLYFVSGGDVCLGASPQKRSQVPACLRDSIKF